MGLLELFAIFFPVIGLTTLITIILPIELGQRRPTYKIYNKSKTDLILGIKPFHWAFKKHYKWSVTQEMWVTKNGKTPHYYALELALLRHELENDKLKAIKEVWK